MIAGIHGPWHAQAASATTNHVVFAGETSLAASYRIRDAWSLRAGYQLLWLEGIALATGQEAALFPKGSLFDPPGPATDSIAASPFYHGAFVGLEFSREGSTQASGCGPRGLASRSATSGKVAGTQRKES